MAKVKVKTKAVAKKAPSAKDKLTKELQTLIKEVDAEGLLYLIQQANVLLHNKRVDEINSEMDKKNKKKKDQHKKSGTTARKGQNVEDVTIEIQQAPDQKTYYLIVNQEKHFLTLAEMKKIVKLSFKPETKTGALKFLHQYLNTERKEILLDHGVGSFKHPFYEALFYEVRAKFSLDD